jgi:hypothetical protein
VPRIACESDSPPGLEASSRVEQLGIGSVVAEMLHPELETEVSREHPSAVTHTAGIGG